MLITHLPSGADGLFFWRPLLKRLQFSALGVSQACKITAGHMELARYAAGCTSGKKKTGGFGYGGMRFT